MKRLQHTVIALFAVAMVACGPQGSELEQKIAQLEDLRTQSADLKNQMLALEAEIVELDPSYGENGNNIILVEASQVAQSSFEHKVELRGSVQSRKNVLMSAETMGKIESIKVKQGQSVSRGQALIVLDAQIIRNNIAEVETQLELANIVYERQSNLWENNIGTEIQFLEAKNGKEGLERRLKTLQSQLEQAIVRAPFSGSIDEIPVNEGEMATIGMPLIRIVKPNDMYISADVSEAYVGKFGVGDTVGVYFPSLDRRLTSTVSAVSQVIKSQNRTFEIEVNLPNVDFTLQPNQVTVLEIVDYRNPEALVIPTKLVQRDSKGNFIYQIVEDEDKQIAQKAHITVGVTFDNKTEVLGGLEPGQLIALEGYRDLAPNVAVILAE
ncbi:MAG: efflux RND transporter periplasmic adaptor subunit [Bacteroidota bacterium]